VDEAEKIQSAVFEIARANGIQPKKFFEILYLILIGTPSGPRLGSYIIDIGRENAVKALARSLQV
jgi:lysyl-tRNA synthetase class 1